MDSDVSEPAHYVSVLADGLHWQSLQAMYRTESDPGINECNPVATNAHPSYIHCEQCSSQRARGNNELQHTYNIMRD